MSEKADSFTQTFKPIQESSPRLEQHSHVTGTESRKVERDRMFPYLIVGIFLGVVLVKSEAVSWFRIQEMFRFQSFHMYGIIGSAVAIAAPLVALIKKFRVKNVYGDPIQIKPKPFERGYSQFIGGTIFGLGWALVGACPGPLYALIGAGVTVIVVTLLSAIAGAYVYGLLKPRLPH